jgi:hypothetical protein
MIETLTHYGVYDGALCTPATEVAYHRMYQSPCQNESSDGGGYANRSELFFHEGANARISYTACTSSYRSRDADMISHYNVADNVANGAADNGKKVGCLQYFLREFCCCE